jgi:hypothetical protein
MLKIKIQCWNVEYSKRICSLGKKCFFENFNISTNNIISVESTKVLQYSNQVGWCDDLKIMKPCSMCSKDFEDILYWYSGC